MEPDTRIIRECGSNVSEIKTDCYGRMGFKTHKSICECDKSYCNGAFKSNSSSLFFRFGGIIYVIIQMFAF